MIWTLKIWKLFNIFEHTDEECNSLKLRKHFLSKCKVRRMKLWKRKTTFNQFKGRRHLTNFMFIWWDYKANSFICSMNIFKVKFPNPQFIVQNIYFKRTMVMSRLESTQIRKILLIYWNKCVFCSVSFTMLRSRIRWFGFTVMEQSHTGCGLRQH